MHKFLSVSPCRDCDLKDLPKEKCSVKCQILKLYQFATENDPNPYNPNHIDGSIYQIRDHTPDHTHRLLI